MWMTYNEHLCAFGFFWTSNYFLRVGFTSVHIFLRGGFYFNGSWQIFQIAFQRHSTNFRVSSATNGLLVCLGFCQQKSVNVMRKKKFFPPANLVGKSGVSLNRCLLQCAFFWETHYPYHHHHSHQSYSHSCLFSRVNRMMPVMTTGNFIKKINCNSFDFLGRLWKEPASFEASWKIQSNSKKVKLVLVQQLKLSLKYI